jgi:hypothetical protein
LPAERLQPLAQVDARLARGVDVDRVRRDPPAAVALAGLAVGEPGTGRVADDQRRVDEEQRVVDRVLLDPVDGGLEADRPARVADRAAGFECDDAAAVRRPGLRSLSPTRDRRPGTSSTSAVQVGR